MFNVFRATAMAAAAGLICSTAFAAPPAFLGSSNSALAFVAIDQVGTPTSLMVDLSFSFSEFYTGSPQYNPNQSVVWNFNNNTVSVNGVNRPGTYNWSSQYNIFQGAAQAAETTFAVLGGTTQQFPFSFVTTGAPTAAQLTAPLDISQLTNAENVWIFNGTSPTSTFSQPGFGANAFLNNNNNGYVAASNIFGPNGDWQGTLNFSALRPEGQISNIYALTDDFNAPVDRLQLPGTFAYNQGVLTFTTPVPEPSALAMTLAGMAVLYGVGRRRREER